MTADAGADLAARLTLESFDAFDDSFRAITRRARHRFEHKEWDGARWDAAQRIDLYDSALNHAAERLERALGTRVREPQLWSLAKHRYLPRLTGRYDAERAETFFNSATRKMLHTVGINREVEFFHLHPRTPLLTDDASVCRTYNVQGDTCATVLRILEDAGFAVAYENVRRDAETIAREIDLILWPLLGLRDTFTIDVVRAPFFRNKEAYLVGRIAASGRTIPLIVPLVNGESGIYADTVLLREDEASVVFSFAYSYFFVDVERYDALIAFLQSILPGSELGELYSTLGYHRHGKTEFYRDLHRFVHVSKEQFTIAPGKEGAVMIVFTLPSYGYVFKVIKDRPCFLRSMQQTPKATTADRVRYQYSFVCHRDRAGRMVDTQEFENLRFRTRRFSADVLNEFAQAARAGVSFTGEHVILHHVYVQRRVVPLPLYFGQEQDAEAIRRVLIDFGYFLKDLAGSGVFPCDLFNTWNYGVTHWGRVVLYDYDDVAPIERITFREKPSPRDEFEEFVPEEDWIVAGEEEFFVDEMDRYSGIPRSLKGVFKSVHGDLYTVAFWNTLKESVRQGVLFDVVPYARQKRFFTRDHAPGAESRS